MEELNYLALSYADWLHPSSRNRGSSARDALENNIEALLEAYDPELIEVLREMNAGEITLEKAKDDIDLIFFNGDRGVKL